MTFSPAGVAPRTDASGRMGPGARGRVLVATVVLLAVACTAGRPSAPGGADSRGRRPFSADSPWNARIPADPVLDPGTERMAGYLARNGPGVAALSEFGVPVYAAGASTPRYPVACRAPWGVCDLARQPVPVPDGARPAPGSDAAMVVVDWAERRSYEFWEAERLPGGGWTAGWGGVVDVEGDGHAPGGTLPTGAGVSRLAGVVRAFELERGRIPHALVFSTDNACWGGHRYPATKTDGTSGRPDCIPEGARVQLDPRVDVAALSGVSPAERMVAVALQRHGAYAIDNGGAAMAIVFETPRGARGAYARAGLSHDYQALAGIPWRRLRVLRRWDGG
ncbi:MAG: hypothetical protein KY434_03470 [Actinobacteria bacterium]|nr:hypothetical protein [Actinomycetota bacterium]